MAVEQHEIARNDTGKDQAEPSALHSEFTQELSKQQQAIEPRTVTLTPVTQNGITCQRHDGGTYPENGHYFDCTTNLTTEAYSGYALSQLQATWGQPGYGTNVKNKLSAAPVDFYVFDDAIEYANRVGGGLTPQQAYTKYQIVKGFSNDPPFAGGRFTVAWALDATNPPNYPNEVQATLSGMKNTTAHEAGHQFDWTVNGGNYPSATAQFNTLAGKDQAYMQANDPNYSGPNGDYAKYAYWLQSNSMKQGPWAELFAEEFAKRTAGQILPVDGIIQSYWKCTDFATQYWMTNSTAPTAANFTNAGLGRCN
ncbi:MAG: hypothetical protein AB1457_18355 [Chloroflexota bacterium]